MNEENIIDVTVFGGCSVDEYYYQLEDGSYPEAPSVYVPGGKGANQAVAAARAGAKVNMISRIGNDIIGKRIIENLQMNDVNTEAVEMLDGVANDITKVFVPYDGVEGKKERVNIAINRFTPSLVETYADMILSSKIVVAQMKTPKEVTTDLIEFCHSNYIPIMITPCHPEKLTLSADPSNSTLLDKISFITCNKEESSTIFETDNIEECVSKYPNKLIVTLADEGVIYHDGNKVIHLPAIKPDKIIDTVGTGDTFAGNLAVFLAQGCNLKESIFKAQFATAIKIGFKYPQGGMPYEEELDNSLQAYLNGRKLDWQKIHKKEPVIFSKEDFK